MVICTPDGTSMGILPTRDIRTHLLRLPPDVEGLPMPHQETTLDSFHYHT